MVIELRHAGIVVTDLERALGFYRDLLGLKIVRTMDESGPYLDNLLGLKDVRVTTVKLAPEGGGALVELLFFQSPIANAQGKRGIYEIGPSHVAFTVQDLDGLFQRLSRAGVSFTTAPQISPDGLAKVAFCQDPDGSPIELVEMLEVID
jgi:catechol 2,3-dioxygenase-like lactoylglutathione lyase family enzyme